jgi:hypothetical protein
MQKLRNMDSASRWLHHVNKSYIANITLIATVSNFEMTSRNSMVQRSSWEASSRLAGQEILRLLWTPKVH